MHRVAATNTNLYRLRFVPTRDQNTLHHNTGVLQTEKLNDQLWTDIHNSEYSMFVELKVFSRIVGASQTICWSVLIKP